MRILAIAVTLGTLTVTSPTLADPVVVELFTSQGCSSCPPADAFLADLARRPDVLALSFHVTYWNGLGWTDPYALQAATNRQRAYARHFRDDEVYTPEMVVDGATGFVGSRRSVGLAAIAQAKRRTPPAAAIRIDRSAGDLVVTLGSGAPSGDVLLVGFDAHHRTHIGRGENGGLDLDESDIVRSITVAARYTGSALTLRQPPPAGGQFAVLLQADDGHIIGAARAILASANP
ncbi:DUF1223 domain-containing protein [Lichenicoccus sp.]|uniref:DUF1223 domain-containing protein n=1 Tax=Lichenicoccus sp. TaxID=2781899 RepID=UPI003D0C5E15